MKISLATPALWGALFLALFSCTRQAEKTPLKDADQLVIGPSEKDTPLVFTIRPIEDLKKQMTWKGEVSSADYFRAIESLRDISNVERNERILDLSRKLYESFYSLNSTHGITTFADSIYLDMALGEAEPEIRKQLNILDKQITEGTKSISGLIDNSKKSFEWPAKLDSFNAGLDVLDTYANNLMKGLTQIGLTPTLEKAAISAIGGEYKNLRPSIEKMAKSLDSAENFQDALDALENATNELKIPLGKEEADLLQKGNDLAKELAQMESSQDALTLIINVWRMVPPEDREAAFKERSPDIYEFLNGKSKSDLKCLAAKICANPVMELARRVAILPKISAYGVHRIQNEIDSAALSYLKQSILTEATKFLPSLPDFVKKEMQNEVAKVKKLFALIQKDMPGFVRKRAAKWQKENLRSNITGLEIAGFSLDFSGRENISITTPKDLNSTKSSGAEVIGMSLFLAQAFLPENENKLRAAMLSPVLKMIAMGGFRQVGGEPYPSLNLPFQGKRDHYFTLKNLLKENITYAVPDSFMAKNNFLMERKNVKANASVVAQAELLRGVSKQIHFFRDWEKNIFDDQLATTQIEDMISEVPKGAINFSLFPKEYIYTLAVGNAGAILQNVIQGLSPAFLLLPGDELLWGDHYKEISDNKFSTIAGLVNLENGLRSKTVKTDEVARYILALDEFLEACEGIENTKSPILQEKNAEGITVVEQLTDARRYLKLFMLGLTNYLVHVSKKDDGGVPTFAKIDKKLEVLDGPHNLTTQALAIRAMLATAKRLNMPIYHWSALNTYYFMNKNMWNKETQFYRTEGGKPATFSEILLTIQALQDIQPIMEPRGRFQVQRAIRPWITAIEDF